MISSVFARANTVMDLNRVFLSFDSADMRLPLAQLKRLIFGYSGGTFLRKSKSQNFSRLYDKQAGVYEVLSWGFVPYQLNIFIGFVICNTDPEFHKPTQPRAVQL